MDGHRALIYSRVRKNKLNPADTDFSRAERNQQVLQAVAGQADRLRDAREAAVHRRRPARAGRDRPRRRTRSSRSAGRSSARAAARRCTAGSAGRRAAARSSRRGEPQRDRDGHRRLGAAAARARARARSGPGCVTGNRTLGVRVAPAACRPCPHPHPGWGSSPLPLRRAYREDARARTRPCRFRHFAPARAAQLSRGGLLLRLVGFSTFLLVLLAAVAVEESDESRLRPLRGRSRSSRTPSP